MDLQKIREPKTHGGRIMWLLRLIGKIFLLPIGLIALLIFGRERDKGRLDGSDWDHFPNRKHGWILALIIVLSVALWLLFR